jgi:hypothetical protein
MLCGSQVRAGRAMLRWTSKRLANESGLATRTVEKIEAADGVSDNALVSTLVALEQTFAKHGIKLVAGGVTRVAA